MVRTYQDYCYDKPRLIGVRIGNKMFAVDVYYRFEPIQTGTRLQYECHLTYSNWFAKFMGRMFGWLTRRILTKQMTMLKALAERTSGTNRT
ncbi:SRPBCC family protein [Brevibacillus sp. H7]|uniref:SRPBCC family protein n=1 Tax=Brevibacillus sp. H7 TaxID=3349138 RepID=UPI0037F8A95B